MRHTKEGVIEKLLASLRPYDVIDESLTDTLLKNSMSSGEVHVQLARRGLALRWRSEGHQVTPVTRKQARDSNVLRGGGMWEFESFYGMTPTAQEAIYTQNETELLLLAALEVP